MWNSKNSFFLFGWQCKNDIALTSEHRIRIPFTEKDYRLVG